MVESDSKARSRYFERRSMEVKVLPSISGRSLEIGQRRSLRRMMTSETDFPIRCGEIPNRVVSTSGSSGMDVNLAL